MPRVADRGSISRSTALGLNDGRLEAGITGGHSEGRGWPPMSSRFESGEDLGNRAKIKSNSQELGDSG
jgi:hypothetical protein